MLRDCVIVFALLWNTLAAQSPQGSISGAVEDSQGASVLAATVTATHLETGLQTAVRSNESGFYSIQALPVGPYTVRVEAAGFQSQVQKNVVLTTGDSLQLSFTLQVGQVTESIVVTSEAPLLETRTSGATQLIEAQTIEDIPLSDRRALNVMELQGASVFVSPGSRPFFSVGGGRGRSQNFVMDGGSAQTIRLGQAQVEVDPPVETLKEVRVLTNGFSAEYGGSASGVIVMNTKSGGNQFHGSLFEYFRNQKLDAANFFAPWVDGAKERAPIRYSVFGGTLSGPIQRNKTFFFFGAESGRRRDGRTVLMTVPTQLERSGDYSQTFNANGSLATVYDPATSRTAADGSVTRTAFPGNRIPSNRLDTVARNLIAFYPLPNSAPDNAAGTNNFRANTSDPIDRDTYTAKVDYALSDQDRFNVRYLWNREDSSSRTVYADPGAEPDGIRKNSSYNLMAGWTRVVRANLIHEFRSAWVSRQALLYTPSWGLSYPTKLGLKGVADEALPRFNVQGYAPLGSNTHRRDQTPIQQFQVVNSVSWIAGTHSVRFGGEARRSRNRDVRLQQVSGQFTFNRAVTGLPNRNTTGNSVASLMLGTPNNFRGSRPPAIDRSSWYLGLFVQDDWQVHRDLVLNIGLRWEADTPFVTRDNILNSFETTPVNPVSGTPGIVRFAGLGGYPATPHEPDWNNFGPRVGFAWKPFGNKKTVVRAAYGIFFAAPYDGGGAVTTAALGFGENLVIPTGDDGTPIVFRLSEGVPAVPISDELGPGYGAVRVGQQTATSVSFYERDRRTGYSQQLNFRIQRELPGSMAVEAGYLGNLSRKMPSDALSINQVRPELVGPGNNQVRRPFPQFSDVLIEAPTLGVINYHAFALRAEKRFSGGLNLLATYTWAKLLDNTTSIQGLGNEGSPYSNFYNRQADYGPSDNDIRHRITWSSVYQIPLGSGRKHRGGAVPGAIFGNWSIGSVLIWHTGPPFTVRTSTNTTQAFSAGPLRADVLRDPNLPGSQRFVFRWFDTEAFQQPAQYLFGNQGVNLVRAAGRLSMNLSALRDFRFGEKVRLQLRGEAFNLLNHANFGLPGNTLGNANYGIVSSAMPPRQMQIGGRVVF